MTATHIPKPVFGSGAATSPSGQEVSALPASTEDWIERMMRGMERMHRDEDYRLEIAKRLS